MIQNLITGLVAQNRYNTRDLALAAHADVYSRFMLTARRMLRCDDKEVQAVGGTALCSARFSAFFGFFDKEYSKHDYFLGRQNCREFLTRELAMPFEQNPLGYTKAQAKTFGHEDIVNGQNVRFVPIIPVMPSLAQEDEMPTWPDPKYTFDPDTLWDAVHNRASKVVDAFFSSITSGSAWYLRALEAIPRSLVGALLAHVATNATIDAIKTAKKGDCSKNLPPL